MLPTEQALWLRIADAFDKYNKTKVSCNLSQCGLCNAVNRVFDTTDGFYLDLYISMREKIAIFLARRRDDDPTADPIYLAPYLHAYAAERASIARQFALECAKDSTISKDINKVDFI